MQPADRSRQRKHRSTNQEQLKHLVLILLTHPTSHTPPCSDVLANTWAFLVKQFSKEETYFSFIIIWGLVLAKCAASFALWAYRLQEITEWPFALLSLDWLSPRLRPRQRGRAPTHHIRDEHPSFKGGRSQNAEVTGAEQHTALDFDSQDFHSPCTSYIGLCKTV